MAISVNYLREQQRTWAKKDQAGYNTDAEFNLALQSAEITLFEYYYKKFEATNNILDALLPFIKEIPIALTSGVGDFPTDYYHRLQVSYKHVINNCANGPKVNILPVDYMQTNEEAEVLSSAIRKPSIAKKIIRHTYKNGKIYVYPITVKTINFKYLRKPVFGEYVSTITSTPNGDTRVFDAAASTDLEWGEQEAQNILDLLMFYLGIEIRSSSLIEFARLKQKEGLIN